MFRFLLTLLAVALLASQLLAAPSTLAAITVSSTQIDLSWTDNADNETGFIIEGSLAGQTFAQIGTALANAISFPAIGLTPNSQYQFRVRATNYAGNSAYSSTATAITGAPAGDQPGPDLTPGLLSFAIYSQDLTVVNDGNMFTGGGAVGSNTLVKIGYDAKIYGDVVSGGNVEIKDRSLIQGNVTCGGTLTKVASNTITGTITENASVTTIIIPTLPAISYGATNITAESGQSIPLPPGSYKNLTINPGGAITFTQGVYNFKSFTIGNNATALFDVPTDKVTEINVETTLAFLDHATAKFPVKGYAPCVKIHTNAYEVNIGCDVKLTGILTAPNAAVHIFSRTNVAGAIYAKGIQIEPDAIFVSDCVNPNADNDRDGVPNLTEMVLGDAPDDGEDFTMMGIPNPAAINNMISSSSVDYDFDFKYHVFPTSQKVTITYPANSLRDASTAPILEMLNKPPEGIREFDLEDYKIVGNYMCMTKNHINSGYEVMMGLPLFATNRPSAVTRKIAWYDNRAGEWQASTSFWAANGAVYGSVSNANAMIIIETESPMTAYLDNGMVYSSNTSEAVASVEANVSILTSYLPSGPDEIGGLLRINYIDFPKDAPPGDVPIHRDYNLIYFGRGSLLVCSGKFVADHRIKVTSICIYSENNDVDYRLTQEFIVDAGQSIVINANTDAVTLNSTLHEGDRISVFYNAKSLSFESLAFGEGVVKKHTSDGSWFYNYYLKDHLGSTRMVLADNGDLVDASTYHPYGKMVPVITGTESVRERFTGKELDKDGAVYDGSGVQIAAGMGLQYFGARYYDAEVGTWTSGDPAEQYWNSYSYVGGNPVYQIDPDGQTGEPVFDLGRDIVYGEVPSSGSSGASAAFVGINVFFALYNFYQTIQQVERMQNLIAQVDALSSGSIPTNFAGEIDGVFYQNGHIVGETGIEDATLQTLAMVPPMAPIKGAQLGINVSKVVRSSKIVGSIPKTPIGRSGNPLNVIRGTNAPTSIGGRQFTGHALDQMQSRGIMPTVVENAIQHGAKSAGNTVGTTAHLFENVKVITNQAGDVITVIPK